MIVTNNTAPSGPHHEENVNTLDQVTNHYIEEREKRLRDDGNAQYIDISLSDQYKHFHEDPWVDPAAVKDIQAQFPNNHCEVLIIGAGFGGLLYAIRMLEAGIRCEDIRIIDSAGGFGGTWYWNRHPGLMCDIESYCYLPLLEETGYMPKHRYSYSEEIREYANLIAEKWGLTQTAVFQTGAQKLEWDEDIKEWKVDLVQHRKGELSQTLNIGAHFVVMASGLLHWPKLPGLPGLLDYKGEVFHPSRWPYTLTGGSPSDPCLSKLQDKRVAVIGTGATAIQIIPHLARWSKHLHVVQRTPASVDHRGQRETNTEWFCKEVATSKGWQRERMRNFNQQITLSEKPAVNLVNDGWTHAPGLVGITGNANGPKSMEEVPAYVKELNKRDLPRQNRIRARVEHEVKDPTVAEKLKPWYPTWCKRPCFHDEYLETFNRDNVTLIDTDGKGPDGLTADSIIIGNKLYPVDVIVFSTGYRSSFAGSVADSANMVILGRNGVSMSNEWAKNGPMTLHGILDYNFPNLFHAGLSQSSSGGNYVFTLDALSNHASYILREAIRKADEKPFAIAPTFEAAENWGTQILMHATPFAVGLGCTPSYLNAEGEVERMPPEKQIIAMRSGLWGSGIEDFLSQLETWRAGDNMKDIEVWT